MRRESLPATPERRLHKRFSDDGSGVAVLYPNFVFSIDVLDISRGGLAFTYKGWEEWSGKNLLLDYVTGNNFLNKIPCEIVSDVQLDHKNALRRCGLRFKELTDQQVNQINELLRAHGDVQFTPPIEEYSAKQPSMDH